MQKQREPSTHNQHNGSSANNRRSSKGKKEAAYQSNAAGVASVRSSASPGRLLSPRLGQDSVGNFVIFGRAGEKRGRRG